MKPLPPFKVNIENAKKYVADAIDYLSYHKDDPDMSFNDYQQLSWELDNALGWLKSVERYYNATIKGNNNETNGH